jgi:hypothetical protein
MEYFVKVKTSTETYAFCAKGSILGFISVSNFNAVRPVEEILNEKIAFAKQDLDNSFQ